MINEKIKKLLPSREFVYVATSDLSAVPNVAPKFLIKADAKFIYLIDYVVGKTWANIHTNPRVSLAFMDIETLTAYQINGAVTFLAEGPEFTAVTKDLQIKKESLTIERVIQGVRRGKKHSDFEADFPSHGVVLKVKVEEVVEVGPSGKLTHEKV